MAATATQIAATPAKRKIAEKGTCEIHETYIHVLKISFSTLECQVSLV